MAAADGVEHNASAAFGEGDPLAWSMHNESARQPGSDSLPVGPPRSVPAVRQVQFHDTATQPAGRPPPLQLDEESDQPPAPASKLSSSPPASSKWDETLQEMYSPKQQTPCQPMRWRWNSARASWKEMLAMQDIPSQVVDKKLKTERKWAWRFQRCADHVVMQVFMVLLSFAHCAVYNVNLNEVTEEELNMVVLWVWVTGGPLAMLTSFEVLSRVAAQGGPPWLLTSWRNFLGPYYHRLEACVLGSMLYRVIMSGYFLWTVLEGREVDEQIRNSDKATVLMLLFYRGMRAWGIYYHVSVQETQLKREELENAPKVWWQEHEVLRQEYDARIIVRLARLSDLCLPQLAITCFVLMHCGLYGTRGQEGQLAWTAEFYWLSRYTGYCLLMILANEFFVRVTSQGGEVFFTIRLHQVETAFMFWGGMMVMWATWNHNSIKDNRSFFEPSGFSTSAILVANRCLRWLGIWYKVSASQWDAKAVFDAQVAKMFMAKFGDAVEVPPQNIHIDITTDEITVRIDKAKIKPEAFEGLHLPVTLHNALIKEFYVKIRNENSFLKLRRGEEKLTPVTELRVNSLLLILGPGQGLAEAGGLGISAAKEGGYWQYESVREAKAMLVELISKHLTGTNPPQHQPQGQTDDPMNRGSVVHRAPTTVSHLDGVENGGKVRIFRRWLDQAKDRYKAFFKEVSLRQVKVDIKTVLVQYEDPYGELGCGHVTVGVKVGSLQAHRVEKQFLSCTMARLGVQVQTQSYNVVESQIRQGASRSSSSCENGQKQGEEWRTRLSRRLKEHPARALSELRRLDVAERFRLVAFEQMDESGLRPLTDRQRHLRHERWPESSLVLSVPRVHFYGSCPTLARSRSDLVVASTTLAKYGSERSKSLRSSDAFKTNAEAAEEPSTEEPSAKEPPTLRPSSGGSTWQFRLQARPISIAVDDEQVRCLLKLWSCTKAWNDHDHAFRWRPDFGLCDPELRTLANSDMTTVSPCAPDDREAVLAAVRRVGAPAVRSASEELRANFDFMREALKEDGRALMYASPDLRANEELQAFAAAGGRRQPLVAVARLWWIYAVSRVLAQLRLPPLRMPWVEIMWRSVTQQQYSTLLMEVADRKLHSSASKPGYGDVQNIGLVRPRERRMLEDLQVRLPLADIFQIRRQTIGVALRRKKGEDTDVNFKGLRSRVYWYKDDKDETASMLFTDAKDNTKMATAALQEGNMKLAAEEYAEGTMKAAYAGAKAVQEVLVNAGTAGVQVTHTVEESLHHNINNAKQALTSRKPSWILTQSATPSSARGLTSFGEDRFLTEDSEEPAESSEPNDPVDAGDLLQAANSVVATGNTKANLIEHIVGEWEVYLPLVEVRILCWQALPRPVICHAKANKIFAEASIKPNGQDIASGSDDGSVGEERPVCNPFGSIVVTVDWFQVACPEAKMMRIDTGYNLVNVVDLVEVRGPVQQGLIEGCRIGERTAAVLRAGWSPNQGVVEVTLPDMSCMLHESLLLTLLMMFSASEDSVGISADLQRALQRPSVTKRVNPAWAEERIRASSIASISSTGSLVGPEDSAVQRFVTASTNEAVNKRKLKTVIPEGAVLLQSKWAKCKGELIVVQGGTHEEVVTVSLVGNAFIAPLRVDDAGYLYWKDGANQNQNHVQRVRASISCRRWVNAVAVVRIGHTKQVRWDLYHVPEHLSITESCNSNVFGSPTNAARGARLFGLLPDWAAAPNAQSAAASSPSTSRLSRNISSRLGRDAPLRSKIFRRWATGNLVVQNGRIGPLRALFEVVDTEAAARAETDMHAWTESLRRARQAEKQIAKSNRTFELIVGETDKWSIHVDFGATYIAQVGDDSEHSLVVETYKIWPCRMHFGRGAKDNLEPASPSHIWETVTLHTGTTGVTGGSADSAPSGGYRPHRKVFGEDDTFATHAPELLPWESPMWSDDTLLDDSSEQSKEMRDRRTAVGGSTLEAIEAPYKRSVEVEIVRRKRSEIQSGQLRAESRHWLANARAGHFRYGTFDKMSI